MRWWSFRWVIAVSSVAVLILVASTVVTFVNVDLQTQRINSLTNVVAERVNISRLLNSTYNTDIYFLNLMLSPGDDALLQGYNQTVSATYTYINQLNMSSIDMTQYATQYGSSVALWDTQIQACGVVPCTPAALKAVSQTNQQQLLLLRASLTTLQNITNTQLNSRTGAVSSTLIISEEILTPLLCIVILLVICAAVLSLRQQGKAAETRLAEAQTEIKSKNRFLRETSHEFRSPLNTILSMSELLTKTQLNEYQASLLVSLQQGANDMLLLINDMLAYLKLQSGSLTLHPQWVSTRAYLAGACNPFRLRANLKKLQFRLHLDESLPPAIYIDIDRFRQILNNLLENAIKFTERGSIECSCTYQDNYLKLRVVDQGIGMSDDELKKIFQPFVQANDKIASKYGGTGIGLACVSAIVDCMQGSKSVTSTVGMGTTFEVCVQCQSRSELPEELVEPTVSSAGSDLEYFTHVLVVDDTPANVKVMQRVLENIGVPLIGAVADGVEAINYWIEHEDLECILCDLNLGSMDGDEVTRRIRALERQRGRRPVRIVAVTGAVSEEDQKRCVDAGMEGFLEKPITIANVKRVLQQ